MDRVNDEIEENITMVILIMTMKRMCPIRKEFQGLDQQKEHEKQMQNDPYLIRLKFQGKSEGMK